MFLIMLINVFGDDSAPHLSYFQTLLWVQDAQLKPNLKRAGQTGKAGFSFGMVEHEACREPLAVLTSLE